MVQGMDWHIFDLHMYAYHYIQNLKYILVDNQEDFHGMMADTNKLLDHLFLYIDCLVHMVMECKEH